jgi:hypothetical protein
LARWGGGPGHIPPFRAVGTPSRPDSVGSTHGYSWYCPSGNRSAPPSSTRAPQRLALEMNLRQRWFREKRDRPQPASPADAAECDGREPVLALRFSNECHGRRMVLQKWGSPAPKTPHAWRASPGVVGNSVNFGRVETRAGLLTPRMYSGIIYAPINYEALKFRAGLVLPRRIWGAG